MSPGSSPRVVVLAALACAVGLAACSGEEKLAPAPSEGGEGGAGAAGASTASASTAVASSGAGTPVREVFIANPFGDQVGNLLSDGDFELSITGNPGQQGWNFYGANGSNMLLAETGGLCRSGLRCGVLPRGGVLLARGTAAPDRAPMTGELWVKPLEDQSCTGVDVYVLSCEDFSVRGQLGGQVAIQPEDGWCPLRGAASASSIGVCLYIENTGGPVLVDNASLRAADESASKRVAIPTVSAATRARMDAIRAHLRTLPIGSERPRGWSLELDPRP